MRGMNSASVDLIYLDPPFNSKADYAAPIGSEAAGAEFKDTWSLNDVDIAWLDLIEAKHPKLWRVIQAAMTDSDKSYLIYMAARLLEMSRLLKPSGSIYLHCDPTMSHYLKLVMDAVWGRKKFRNEVIWQRYGSHNDAHRYGRVTDTLLFYADSSATWTAPRIPLSDTDIATRYSNKDDRGRYTTSPLHARTLSGGGYNFEWKGIIDVWKFPKERLDELEKDGQIHWPVRGSVPRRKVYLADNPGKPLSNLWADISIAGAKERVGYPTQKPRALLQRIIEASSAKNDIVLDPFCGCATACIAAEYLDRRWIGIDISEKAADLVQKRMKS
ncbi:MAG: site-specific DNA-methyltransferase [Rhodobacteraceae bacterium]|nr:site-specific DNA-methyltransferase [Paracoccaceae bacterium]